MMCSLLCGSAQLPRNQRAVSSTVSKLGQPAAPHKEQHEVLRAAPVLLSHGACRAWGLQHT